MQISSSLKPQVRSAISTQAPKANESTTFHNEPIDGWNPGESKAMASLAPYSMAVIGAGAGLVAGFAEGPAALIGGAVALGAAGAGAALFTTGLSEMGGGEGHYGRNALIGAGVGAGLGVLAGSAGGPLVGVAAAVLGGYGAYVAGSFAQ
jgi:hypothetical protein